MVLHGDVGDGNHFMAYYLRVLLLLQSTSKGGMDVFVLEIDDFCLSLSITWTVQPDCISFLFAIPGQDGATAIVVLGVMK